MMQRGAKCGKNGVKNFRRRVNIHLMRLQWSLKGDIKQEPQTSNLELQKLTRPTPLYPNFYIESLQPDAPL